MLRILLIILVALAVIIGLMRLTGSRSGDAAPAAAASETVEEGVIEPAPATEDYIVDEPATDSLDVPPAIEGETTVETIAPDAGETVAGEAVEVPSEEPPVESQTENAAAPVEPASVEPAPVEPESVAPASVEPAPDAAAPPAGEQDQPGL